MMAESLSPGLQKLLGEPAFATPQFIRRAAEEALARPRLGYSANAGLAQLRALVAKRYGRESSEEIGLQPGHVRIIGRLDDQVTRTGFHITAVVGLIDEAQSPYAWLPQPSPRSWTAASWISATASTQMQRCGS